MKRKLLALCFGLAATAILQAQTPTITSVTNESGSSSLCPGGIAFISGTNLAATAQLVVMGGKPVYAFNATATSLQVELPVDAPLGATTIKAGASNAFSVTLVQYAPGLPINSGLPAAFHSPSGVPVTASFPATPNESIMVLGTGLGPTNPVYATGTAPGPNDPAANVVTKPTVSIEGKAVTVQAATLEANSPGFYAIIITMRADVTTGNQPINISIGGLTSNTGNLPVSTGPVISQVTNAASYMTLGPSRGIAQGSIFVIKGINMGPAALAIDPNAFQDTTFSGTSVAVTVSGTAVAALIYYTSAGQIAALLPSNTPTGAGTVTVTYNGNPGPAAPVVVVANTLGIFTVTSDGNGAGIVTYPDYSLVSQSKAANCGGVYTTCGAANPGDVLILWATGLGPVSGNDASGAGLGVNMSSLPLTVWLGNVSVTAVYQGRSGCCIGEDQIVFTVPANTPTGCSVPLSVQIGNSISNNVSLAVAPAGNRTCSVLNPAVNTSAAIAQVNSTGTFTLAELDLTRPDFYPNFPDNFHGIFARFAIDPALRPFVLSLVDSPPAGTCQVYNSPNGQSNAVLNSAVGLDAGPQLAVQASAGSQTVTGSGGSYKGTLSPNAAFLTPGVVTITGPGGADVLKFSASITIPPLPTMTSPPPDPANPFSVTRSNGLTVTWSGGSPSASIELDGFSNTDNAGTAGMSFQCTAPAASGSFTIPSTVLSLLPAGNFGGLDFHPSAIPVTFTGTGLTVNLLTLQYDYFTPLIFK